MTGKMRSIYEERAKIYNCSINIFDTEGITLLEVESLRKKNYFTLASFGNRLILRVDPEMETPFDKHDISMSGKPLEFINSIKEYYASSERSLEKTYCGYYYLKDEQLVSNSNLTIDRITEENTEQLKTFLSSLSEEELDLADIELDELDPVIFGGFKDNKMVGYISHRYPNGHEALGDIGIVIDADYRGNGFGKAMLIHEVNWCLRHEIVPMYFVLDDNKASVSLVQQLGFDKVCDIYILK